MKIVRTSCAVILALSAATALAGSGNYLIVTASDYAGSAALNEFVNAKSAMGFDVSVWAVPDGTSRADIKAYIQGLWGTPDAPDYLLIVGDTPGTGSATASGIPHWIGEGSREGTTDLPYACMDPGDDWYPDMFHGRFSVTSPSMLQDVVDKTLFVETGVYPDPDYVYRAAFLATDDSTAQAEQIHDFVIQNYLAPAGFNVDKVYANQGGGTSDVTHAVNNGVLFCVYFGHSSSSGWWTPGFNQSNVESLSNTGLYGLAMGWSCNTAHYSYDECFGETWLRAPNKGAAAYLSASDYVWWGSVSSWESSRRMEKYFFESIFVDGYREIGPAWQDALWKILADPDFGPSHDHTRNIFEEFIILGDPSLRLPGACSDEGTAELDDVVYYCEDTATITVEDCGLNVDPAVIETVDVTIDSDSEPAGETVTLTESGPGSAEFVGTIVLSETDAVGVLLVADGDLVTLTYVDADNGQGGANIVVTDTAAVDCAPPVLSNIHATGIGSASADIAFDANERVLGTVHYGTDCGNLVNQTTGSGFSPSPAIAIDGLSANTQYFYAVEAVDEAGNMTYDDNGGQCYSFVTVDGPSMVYSFPFDSDPGWACEGQWAFGQPTGGGGQYGGPDPTSGYTGSNVYGYNLDGDYENNLPERHLTSSAIDCTDLAEVHMKFWRWLGVEQPSYDHAYVRVSNDGTNWTTVWENSDTIEDSAWQQIELDISAVADGAPTVYLRWTMGTTDWGWRYCGWNIDDLEIWGVAAPTPGDMNCDGALNAADIDPFVLALTDPNGYAAAYPGCSRMNGDCNSDGALNAGDIDPFVLLLTGP